MNKLRSWQSYLGQLWQPKNKVQETASFDYWEGDDNLGVDSQPYVEYWLKHQL